MHYAVIFVVLLSFVFGLGLIARRTGIPYPILFVIGGLLVSFIPIPVHIKLDPDFVFFIFLPPLLYIQAFNTSWRDFRREIRAISLLAVGLVFATTVTVAYVAHWMIPNFPLAAGVVLGAIISPPDAIAASAIAQRLGLPRRVVTILEGESLVNDSTSLVIYGIAVSAAVATTQMPLVGGIWIPGKFLYVTIGGIAVGLAVGWLLAQVRKRILNDGPQIVLTVSLLTPFVSYLAAEPLGFSSVLSVVATGLYMGWGSSEIITPQIRLQAHAIWDMIIYLLNGMIFVLIGLQLPGIVSSMREDPLPQFMGGVEPGLPHPIFYAIVINLVCIVVRFAWVFPGAYAPFLFKAVRDREVMPDWREVFVVSWAGMRGIVSLAASLALGAYPDYPRSHLTQFIAFSVIFTTLVLQGLTLPPLICWLGLSDDGSAALEEKEARERMSAAVLEKIEKVRGEKKYPETAIDHVEQTYRELALSLKDDIADQLGWSDRRHHALSERRLRRSMISTQRRALLGMRREGLIGDDVMHKIEHELDLEEARVKI
jgi:Na+/H+ antiporter